MRVGQEILTQNCSRKICSGDSRDIQGGFGTNRKEIRFWSVDWSYLAQSRDRWWAVVNIVMNLHLILCDEYSCSTKGEEFLDCLQAC
jgi:hypothetical protein